MRVDMYKDTFSTFVPDQPPNKAEPERIMSWLDDRASRFMIIILVILIVVVAPPIDAWCRKQSQLQPQTLACHQDKYQGFLLLVDSK